MISPGTLRKRIPALLVCVLVPLLGAGLAVALIPTARSRLVEVARSARSLVRAVSDSGRVRGDSHGNYTNLVFLHHSVGQNLIREGRLRERLTQAGFDLYDHGYNSDGLVRPDGTSAGYSYDVPGDDTDPAGLAHIFEQRVYRLPLNTWSALLQHEVIVVKSCFLAIRTLSDEGLERQKADYMRMRDVMDRHRDKLFIILTSPPANPAETDPAAAARARTLSKWLQSEEFRAGHRNIHVFDLFGLLAENEPALLDFNMLRAAYRERQDSHPNRVANETVAPILAEFIEKSAISWRTQR
jgi:hypothetical protein